ncbi:hypothetical protein C440_00240 [Haloferax mucosum ATCC BAA-1512]|uniref:Uncharacterized protein n=1 Tax=Haloferax mucosum ATCC BAA-1512 TaxID=662479 RepID=M0ISE8_9EURY|nr:hypothetical protein [Haloferax mucosum]ELZ98738.1 hypothetical protein C440_00240 [Haloferax mucosum ATCC BAA-1512]
MKRVRTAGIGVTAVGVVGYGVGAFVAYPGRAFSVTTVMVGITLWAIGGGE